MEDMREREAILAAARRAVAVGLTHGTSGNLSVRVDGGMIITPTGLEYDALAPGDVVGMTLNGNGGTRRALRPVLGVAMHAAVYAARPDVHAIVHGHSPAAAAFSCLGRDLPPFHYMVAAAGGDSIRCARYALFGTRELAKNALEALANRRACFLAHHGFLTLGATLDKALALAVELEFLAETFLRLLPLREPPRLSGPRDEEGDRDLRNLRAAAGTTVGSWAQKRSRRNGRTSAMRSKSRSRVRSAASASTATRAMSRSISAACVPRRASAKRASAARRQTSRGRASQSSAPSSRSSRFHSA